MRPPPPPKGGTEDGEDFFGDVQMMKRLHIFYSVYFSAFDNFAVQIENTI